MPAVMLSDESDARDASHSQSTACVQGLTKTVGRPLLVTEAVRDRATDSFTFEELPPQEVRGIEEKLSVFAVG